MRELLGTADPAGDVEADGRPRWRGDPGRRGALAVAAAAVVVALITGWYVLSGRSHSSTLAPTFQPALPSAVATRSGAAAAISGAATAVSGATTPTVSQVLVVDVVGKVLHPGVYRLPDGARIDDALRAAGGALRGVDLTPLNLAQKLTDGAQVAVGVAGAPAGVAGSASTDSSGTSGSTPVNLNTATVDQLDTLPGVGPVLAQRIVDWRTAHGRFDSVDQLNQVSGIGDAKFADLKSLVTV